MGCPLSPILFAVSLEPLASAIRNNGNIVGVSIGPSSHKFSLFADNTVVYLNNPESSSGHLIQETDRFGMISGFRINYSKS